LDTDQKSNFVELSK